MKSIFIAFDQAYYDRIITKLEKNNCRGIKERQKENGSGKKNDEHH